MACTRLTNKGKPCPIEADRLDGEGKWVCHVHDPKGVFQRQLEALREDRLAEKRRREARLDVDRRQVKFTEHPPLRLCKIAGVHLIADCRNLNP